MDTIDQKGILQYAGAIVSTPGKDADCIKGLWQFGKILRTVNIRLRSFFCFWRHSLSQPRRMLKIPQCNPR